MISVCTMNDSHLSFFLYVYSCLQDFLNLSSKSSKVGCRMLFFYILCFNIHILRLSTYVSMLMLTIVYEIVLLGLGI